MKVRRTISAALATIVLGGAGLSAVACNHHRHHEGPAERAGKKVDRAADRAGDAAEDAGRKINHALPGD